MKMAEHASRIDEGGFADIHGVPQWLTFRGDDRANPALLIVGGPGCGYAALAPFFTTFERLFTLVQWDQPGAGFTFGRNGDAGGLTLDRVVRDGVRVAELACAKLGASRLTLLCFSGGTIVGLQMARQRPDLFSAYVGAGQFVDWRRQDQQSYALLLERARERGDAAMLGELEALGPPPYADAASDARKSQYALAPTRRSPSCCPLSLQRSRVSRTKRRTSRLVCHGPSRVHVPSRRTRRCGGSS
jgi:proline iminopeptidase